MCKWGRRISHLSWPLCAQNKQPPHCPLSLVAVGPGAIVPLGCACQEGILGWAVTPGHGARAELQPWGGWVVSGVVGYCSSPSIRG